MHQRQFPEDTRLRRRVRALAYTAGGVAAAAAVAVGASPADAATTCAYDPATGAVTLTADGGLTPTELITNGAAIRYTAGSIAGSCVGGGVAATAANTEKITVKGTVPTAFNHFIVPAVSLGGSSEGPVEQYDEIETKVLPGSGGDLVDVKGRPTDDEIHVNGTFPTEVR